VDCAIDAVGYQAHDQSKPDKERAPQVIEYCAKIVNPAGNIALIGVYMTPDAGAKGEEAKQGIYPLPIGQLFDNAVTIGMGQAPVKKYNEYLRDLIVQGHAHPGRIVSHHIPIQEAPDAYEKFDKRVEGYNKVLIRFDEAIAG
jgi:glutathione-independent formaldehyde dehydrogenase